MMLSSKNVFDDKITLDKPRFLSEADFKAEDRRTEVSENDVLLTVVGTVGRAAIVPARFPPITLQRSVAVLKPITEVIIPRFLMFALHSILDDLLDGARGVAQKGIYLKALREVLIPLPPLEEQRRIVAVLDEAFEGLARARAHTEANLQNARELFESYISSVFAQGGWHKTTLDRVAENLDRMRVPITKAKRIAGDVPYYGASGIVDHVAEHLFDEDLLLISEDGANLLARTYPIAFSISGKAWVNNHAHVLRFSDLHTQEFVRLYLNSISLEPFVSGMAQPKLNQAQLNRIPIPFPDFATRKQVVENAGLISAETAELKKRFEVVLNDLDDLRQSLLQKAFAGELT